MGLGNSTPLDWSTDRLPKKKTIVVTGGNTGIGYETSKHLAMLGGHVILACRSEDKALKAIGQMKKEYQEYKQSEKQEFEYEILDDLQLEFMQLDLSSLETVVEFVEDFKSKSYPLGILICNAGGGMHSHEVTKDGLEIQFQVNYLSHLLLTILLLPTLQSSGEDTRIINVTSILHMQGSWQPNNVQWESGYQRVASYGNSKLFQIMASKALLRRLKSHPNISIFCPHPGVLTTGLERGWQDNRLMTVLWNCSKWTGFVEDNILRGAASSLILATRADVLPHSGAYFYNGKPAEPSAIASNTIYQEELWKYSMGILKEYIPEDLMKKYLLNSETDSSK